MYLVIPKFFNQKILYTYCLLDVLFKYDIESFRKITLYFFNYLLVLLTLNTLFLPNSKHV